MGLTKKGDEMKPETIMIDDQKYVRADVVNQLAETFNGMKYCIVRTYSAGVFAGYIDRKKNKPENIVYEAIRLWQWFGASLSQIANDGFVDESKCQIPETVNEVSLTGIIEVIPCTAKAKKSIQGIKRWKQ